MHSYLGITSRYMKAHKKRTILTIVGIVLAISLFSSISTLFLSYRDASIEDAKKMSGNYEAEYKQLNEGELNKIVNNAEVSSYGIKKELGNKQVLSEGKELKFKISAYNKSAYENIFKSYFNLRTGRLPLADDEIAIESRALETIGKKLGDSIKTTDPGKSEGSPNNKKDYKIVGIYEENSFQSDIFNGITFLKNESLKDSGAYSAYVNLKERKDKNSAISRLADELGFIKDGIPDISHVVMNLNLLNAEGLMNNRSLVDSDIRTMVIIFAIIIACSAAVIYNDFNIAVVERIRQFGILRAIGATPGQIRRIVVKEAFYMCVIAIPIGILTGYVGLTGVMYAVKKLMNIDYEILNIKFHPVVILISIILAVITIILSIWAPARSAGKINPMDAIKNINEIKNEKIKIRKSKLIKLLFRYEGELAYKNIKRTPKRFWFTLSSLIISIVLLIVFSNFMSAIKQDRDSNSQIPNADAMFIKSSANLSESEINEIRNLDGVDKIYLRAKNFCNFAFPKEYFNKEYVKKTGRVSPTKIEGTDFVATNGLMSFYDDNGLEVAKKYLIDGKIDKKELNNMGVLLVNKNKVVAEPSGAYVTADYSTYKVGDKIVVPKLSSYTPEDIWNLKDKPSDGRDEMKKAIDDKNFYTFTVVGILEKDFIIGLPHDGLGLIFTEDVYKKINGNLRSDSMLIKYKDKEAREKLYEFFNEKAAKEDGHYSDFYEWAEKTKKVDDQMNLFVYAFIALITLIAAVNIINSMIINIQLRNREFALMRAVGMSKEQLTKMVLYEGLIHGVIAIFAGTLIGGILSKLIIGHFVSDIKVRPPYVIILTGLIIAIVLTLAPSIISIRKLKKMNIVEVLRAE